MHLDFIAEGWKPDLDAMEEWLNTRTFQLPIKHKDGSVTIEKAPGALRPRRAYTYVFPRDSLDIVLNTLKLKNCVALVDGKGTPILKRVGSVIRKVLRLKKIPEPDKSKGEFPMVMKNIRLMGLGMRDDIDMTFDNGLTHEAL